MYDKFAKLGSWKKNYKWVDGSELLLRVQFSHFSNSHSFCPVLWKRSTQKGKWSVQVETSWAFLNLKVELKMRHPPSWQDTIFQWYCIFTEGWMMIKNLDHTWSEVHPSSYDPLQFTARGVNHRWMSQPHRIWGLPAHESIPSIQGSSLSCSFHHCCCCCCCYQELCWILLLLGE